VRAAVVSDFAKPPVVEDFPEPAARSGFDVVQMRAAGIHRIVRSIAAGAHYSSGDELPMVIGVDGVGVREDGTRIYTGGSPPPLGTIAERTLVPGWYAVEVPDALSDVQAAAIVNPAMSSWMPLVGATAFVPGATVLVVGAGGVAGRLAVDISLHLGAGRVLAAARRTEQLASFAGDERVRAIALDENLADHLRDAAPDGVDVVLDYLWGPVAEAVLEALSTGGVGRAHVRTDYIQIGSLAGPSITLRSVTLRRSKIVVSGSGIGSIDPAELLAELPRILALAAGNGISVDVRVVPLSELGDAWDSVERLVVTL